MMARVVCRKFWKMDKDWRIHLVHAVQQTNFHKIRDIYDIKMGARFLEDPTVSFCLGCNVYWSNISEDITIL